MSKEIYISSTPHETRLAIVEKDELAEIYYERENEYTLAGSIYNGRVTRVLPGMQSSFVDIGLERDAFLYITDFMEEAADTADFEGAEGHSNGGRRERSDRGDRDRDRGRGGRTREGQGRRDDRQRGTPREGTAPSGEEGFSAEQDDDLQDSPRESAAEDLGEGAPGADGSRRWRGRRGRRRGRGGNEEQGDVTRSSSEGADEGADEGFVAPEIEASASEAAPRRDRGGRNGRRDGGRDGGRDRGGRDSGRNGFGRREARSESGGEEGPDRNASAEPMILPGESLSKYRRGADAEQSEQHAEQKFVAPRPSTEVVPLVGWDGGATLPGETLSRHRGGETRGALDRHEVRHGEQASGAREGRGRDRRRERDARRGRGEERQSFSGEPRGQIDPAEAVLPAVTSQHEVEPSATPFTDDAPAFETETFEQELEAQAEAAHQELQRPQDEAVAEEFHETTAEYEPEEASASYRVDPAGPSEFRQSAPQEDLAEIAFEDVEEHETAPAAAAPVEAAAHEVAAQHEVTTVEPSGEMLSEPEASPVAADAGAFAPGDGQLEEELMDDDEADVPHLQASAADEDMEEETLEGAADLGTMLREMSIDQITRLEEPAGELEEDDDFDIDEEEIDHDEYESGDEISGSDVSEAEEDEFAEAGNFEEGAGEPEAEAIETARSQGEGQRRGRGEGRRDGRHGGRDRSGRDVHREGGSRERISRDGRGAGNSRSGGRSRHSMQTTDLPAISDLLKPGQELLVQIAKEPIAKKGARITSHIALPGRFLVFMPTVSHVGVSRKIESDAERRRLKEILLSEKGEAGGGFIVRTAAAGASEEELRSDLRFLLNLWTDIKQRSESSKSPALIYHDLNLVERILRDQVTDNFSAIWVDTETEYERVLRFLQRFQPSLIRRVKLYSKETPLFEQFGITEEINKALRSKVWLKSGGSIVINQTEALVAIDINTGKFVGKTARLEDTIVKTNLDAIPEIVRQIRLRDLGGIIIIDFIDMDERKNRNRVMAALEDELKNDRAPSKVLQFNDFGLVAITRKRVKQSLERTLSTTCGVCAGTGMVKSPVTVCNDIYIEMRKMHKHLDKGDIMLRVNPEVVKQLKNNGGKWLQEMEEMSGKTILVKSDPALHPEQFDIH